MPVVPEPESAMFVGAAAQSVVVGGIVNVAVSVNEVGELGVNEKIGTTFDAAPRLNVNDLGLLGSPGLTAKTPFALLIVTPLTARLPLFVMLNCWVAVWLTATPPKPSEVTVALRITPCAV